MNSIYLDCSGLHSIRVDSDGLPHSIYIDGQDFINRLNEAIDRIPHPITLTCEELKKQKRWELVLALASNPAIQSFDKTTKAKEVISQADAILKELEKMED